MCMGKEPGYPGTEVAATHKLERAREQAVWAGAAGVGQGWACRVFFHPKSREGPWTPTGSWNPKCTRLREGSRSWIPGSWIPSQCTSIPIYPPSGDQQILRVFSTKEAQARLSLVHPLHCPRSSWLLGWGTSAASASRPIVLGVLDYPGRGGHRADFQTPEESRDYSSLNK